MLKLLTAFFSLIRLTLLKIFHFKGLFFEPIQDFAFSAKIEIQKNGKINLNEKIHLKRYVTLCTLDGGMIDIGAHCYMGEGCKVCAKEKIIIGKDVSFGPNVILYDHDHKFDRDGGYIKDEYNTSPIIIENNVWIGTGAIILKGTKIGEGSVIGAGCIIKGDYPKYSRIVQKRETTIEAMPSKSFAK